MDNIEFTPEELGLVRDSVASELLRTAEILERTGNSGDAAKREAFSYWKEKYKSLRALYSRLR